MWLNEWIGEWGGDTLIHYSEHFLTLSTMPAHCEHNASRQYWMCTMAERCRISALCTVCGILNDSQHIKLTFQTEWCNVCITWKISFGGKDEGEMRGGERGEKGERAEWGSKDDVKAKVKFTIAPQAAELMNEIRWNSMGLKVERSDLKLVQSHFVHSGYLTDLEDTFTWFVLRW